MRSSIIVAIISYLIGNFLSAYILGNILKKQDVRQSGSGNAGATNALRVFGKKVGILALVLDLFKGVLAVYIGGRILGYKGELIAAVFVILGHDWPIFLKFKGGKGIATSLGVILMLHWPTIVVCIVLGVLVIIKTKYVSLGSMIGTFLLPVVGFIMNRPFDRDFFIVTLILAILSIFKHRSNIKRLIQGREPKIGERVE